MRGDRLGACSMAGWVLLASLLLPGGVALTEEKPPGAAPSGGEGGDLPAGPTKADSSRKETKAASRDEVEEAVLRALGWLRRHQDPDGGWKARGFTERCKKPCENLNSARYGKERGGAGHDVGVSALATLALVRYGKVRKEGLASEDRECLKRAASYLLGTQVKSGEDAIRGRFGPMTEEDWIYGHALAALALAEAIDLPEARGSLPAIEEAIKFCLRAQNEGLAWRYGVRSGDNDTSITSWMVQTLKAAERAKVKVPKAAFTKSLKGALAWYDRVTTPSGKTGYMSLDDTGSMLKVHPDPYPYSKRLSATTAACVLGRLLAGQSRSTRKVRDGVKFIIAEAPLWQEKEGGTLSTVNFYYWYYGTQALRLYGGQEWRTWRAALRKALLGSQRRGDIDEAGSWDPIDEWGPAGGRVYSTAINALSLAPLLSAGK